MLRFIAALCVGAGAGAVLGVTLKHWKDAEKPRAAAPQDAPSPAAGAAATEDNAALRYARAFLAQDWAYIIDHTHWMQERLRRVQLETGSAEKTAAARSELNHRLAERAVAGNQLRPEGVETQYVFAPGAHVDLVSIDGGAAGLGRPVAFRAWLRVTYPARAQALRDAEGMPIRSLVAGVNITADGYVLKAGIIGDVEINRDTLTFWTAAPGG